MDEGTERRYVLAALAVVLVAVGVLAVVDYARRPAATPRIELTRRCLEREKHLTVLDLPLDSFLAAAPGGGLVTFIETNRVEIGIAGSPQEAARLVDAGHGAVPPLGAVQLDGDVVTAWERPPSPTQRQTFLDCKY